MSSLKETLKSFSLRAGSVGSAVSTDGGVNIPVTPNTSSTWGIFASFVAPFDCVCVVRLSSSGTPYSGFSIILNGNAFIENGSQVSVRTTTLCAATYQIPKGTSVSLEGQNLGQGDMKWIILYPTVGSQS